MKKMFYLASLLIGGAAFAQITTNEINGIKVNMPLTELNAKFKQDIKPKVVENFTDEPENFTPVTINGTKYNIIFVKDFYSPEKLWFILLQQLIRRVKVKIRLELGVHWQN
jgi:hypothetical protein